MKIALPVIGLALLLSAGCQQTAAPKDASAIDVTTPAPAAVSATATPMTPLPAVESNAAPINATVAAPNTYTVKQGDTLWKIATAQYGNGKKWKQIQDANPGLDPSHLRVGQTIALP